jgi:hypothetical protein
MEMNKYLGLLKWSLKYTDGTAPTSFTPMQEERKKWLQAALENGTADPVDQIKVLISVIKLQRKCSDETESLEEEEATQQENEFVRAKVDALKALQEWVESIDWATDLHKLGGFKTVVDLCQDKDEGIRVHALEVFATVVQNNPKCQEWAMELNALKVLVDSITQENRPVSETEQAKNLLAISSLVRDCNAASVAFVKDHKGLALLIALISKKRIYVVHEKAEIKSLFLMRYFLDAMPVIGVTLAESLVSVLNSSLKSPNSDVREHALHVLKLIYGDRAAVSRIPVMLTAKILNIAEQLKSDDEVSQGLAASLLDAIQASKIYQSPLDVSTKLDSEQHLALKD